MTARDRTGHPGMLALPPPPAFDLLDGDVVVGWVAQDRIGFRGFADVTEAAHAAWLAYRTLARRVARRDGTRVVPIDSEPLAVYRRNGVDVVLATGREIATLIRPGAPQLGGGEDVGFELRVPSPVDELGVRSKAYLIYRTLRKSGIRWALWRVPRTASQTMTRKHNDVHEAGAVGEELPRRGSNAELVGSATEAGQ